MAKRFPLGDERLARFRFARMPAAVNAGTPGE
jgi:hypothetical protein